MHQDMVDNNAGQYVICEEKKVFVDNGSLSFDTSILESFTEIGRSIH